MWCSLRHRTQRTAPPSRNPSALAVGGIAVTLLGAVRSRVRERGRSDIYKIRGFMGVTALVHPILIPQQIFLLDVRVMVAATAALIGAVLAWQKIGRGTGLIFLAAYAVYTGWLVAGAWLVAGPDLPVAPSSAPLYPGSLR